MNVTILRGNFKDAAHVPPNTPTFYKNEEKYHNNGDMLRYKDMTFSKDGNANATLISVQVTTKEPIFGISIQIMFNDKPNMEFICTKQMSDYIEEKKYDTYTYTFKAKDWPSTYDKLLEAVKTNECIQIVITSYRNDKEIFYYNC